MGADMRSVHPDIGVMEHSTEPQEYAIADPILRQLEGAAVSSNSGSAARSANCACHGPGTLMLRGCAGRRLRPGATC